jgi:hypothetical protein
MNELPYGDRIRKILSQVNTNLARTDDLKNLLNEGETLECLQPAIDALNKLRIELVIKVKELEILFVESEKTKTAALIQTLRDELTKLKEKHDTV